MTLPILLILSRLQHTFLLFNYLQNFKSLAWTGFYKQVKFAKVFALQKLELHVFEKDVAEEEELVVVKATIVEELVFDAFVDVVVLVLALAVVVFVVFAAFVVVAVVVVAVVEPGISFY